MLQIGDVVKFKKGSLINNLTGKDAGKIIAYNYKLPVPGGNGQMSYVVEIEVNGFSTKVLEFNVDEDELLFDNEAETLYSNSRTDTFCLHEDVVYHGFNESYVFCKKCDRKRELV